MSEDIRVGDIVEIWGAGTRYGHVTRILDGSGSWVNQSGFDFRDGTKNTGRIADNWYRNSRLEPQVCPNGTLRTVLPTEWAIAEACQTCSDQLSCLARR